MKQIDEQAYKYTKYECGECGYTTDWPESLETHLYTVHGISVDLKIEKQ